MLQNNAHNYDIWISLNNSTFYLITHIVDKTSGTETFRIKEVGQNVVINTQSITTPVDSVLTTIMNFAGATNVVHPFFEKQEDM